MERMSLNMKKYDQRFVEEMRSRLDVELLGAAAINESSPALLREQAYALLPEAKSVFVSRERDVP